MERTPELSFVSEQVYYCGENSIHQKTKRKLRKDKRIYKNIFKNPPIGVLVSAIDKGISVLGAVNENHGICSPNK